MWACACLAAEMSSGRPLFPGEDEGGLVRARPVSCMLPSRRCACSVFVSLSVVSLLSPPPSPHPVALTLSLSALSFYSPHAPLFSWLSCRKVVSMAALLGPVPLQLASRLREMGYTPPPPRGRPTRSLELCLDGSTGDHEVGSKAALPSYYVKFWVLRTTRRGCFSSVVFSALEVWVARLECSMLTSIVTCAEKWNDTIDICVIQRPSGAKPTIQAFLVSQRRRRRHLQEVGMGSTLTSPRIMTMMKMMTLKRLLCLASERRQSASNP